MSVFEGHSFIIRGKEEYLKKALEKLKEDENFVSWFDTNIEHYGNSNKIYFENPEELKIEFALNYGIYLDPVFELTKEFPIFVEVELQTEFVLWEKWFVFNGEVVYSSEFKCDQNDLSDTTLSVWFNSENNMERTYVPRNIEDYKAV